MQRLYGGQDPWVRSGGTLFALHRLRDKGYLSMPDYARLNSAYQYLRALEHRLQLEDDRQVHTLPGEPDALALLARKMQSLHASDGGGEGLLRQVRSHLKNVGEIYDRVVHAQRAMALPQEDDAGMPAAPPQPEPSAEHSWRSQLLHIEQTAPRTSGVLGSLRLHWGQKHFEHLLNKIISMPALLEEFERQPPLLECVADLVEHSPYIAEHLIRHPEDIRRLSAIAASAAESTATGTPGAAFDPASENMADTHPEIEELLGGKAGIEEKSTWLRRFYRLRMLEILAESIYRKRPIFATLEKTTLLADWVLRAAYRIAVEDAGGADGSGGQMSVIALGRLGMREFDLASDADLIFVIPDAEKPRWRRWLQVAERLIEIASSYTREGLIFTVDTRLRPMGRDGELVQTESHYKDYFASRAEAWEGITYMKARTIAGDLGHGKRFLGELQEVGWQRFGRSGDLARLLLNMRQRLEREQGPAKPIKAGPGGYYDIDFILLYLRLRDASVFFESLNTPERIAVVQSMGGLTPDQAARLSETAIFFRALDHAIRAATGHSAGMIPTARSQQDPIAELVRRWSTLLPPGTPLPSAFQRVRRATRELFLEVFQSNENPANENPVNEE
jgi:glutamate-ammonia-ligase adenylyltransferase